MIIGSVLFLRAMRIVLQIQDYYLILCGLKSTSIWSEQEKIKKPLNLGCKKIEPAGTSLPTLAQAAEVQFLCAREAPSGSYQFTFLVDDSHLHFPRANRKKSCNIGI